MNPRSETKPLAIALGLLAVTSAVAVGVLLRLDDPMSSPVIPAEDPYTHMALVREHVRDGSLDPLYDGGTLYPPGMHSFLAVLWIYTGFDLYEIIRLGPAFFGGIGVLGIALLLWRADGPIAAFVGGLAYAVAPEMIFRTTMMSPTALDLAILPFLLYALLETTKGRLGWAGVAAPMTLFTVFAHPWLLLVVTAAGGLFVFLAFAFPWSRARAPPISPRGVAATVSIMGLSVALADTTAGSFRGTLNAPDWLPFGTVVGVVALVALIPALLLLLAPELLDRLAPRARTKPVPVWLRAALSLVVLAALVAATRPALAQGMPDHVDLVRMFGWPILILGVAALLALPFVAGPLAYLGASLFGATYLFVIYNPLESPFWPHRTAAFLGVGLVILVGIAAGAAFRAGVRAVQANTTTGVPKLRVPPAVGVPVVALLVALSLGGGVYAGTPPGYPDGWYRLYHGCDADALEEIAERLDEEPSAVVMTGDWQAKLVLAALADDASRIWFKPSFFTDPETRENDLSYLTGDGRVVHVVIDRYLYTETPEAQTDFLQEDPWQLTGSWCAGAGGFTRPSLVLYSITDSEVHA